MSTYKLINGDCIDEMKKMDANSIDSIVTDPPYEIGFMNKGWDNTGIAYNKDVWKQALRVLKPGGHMLAFSSTRTYHRMVCAIEDSGFEIRDQLAWIYGSGFPKSQNVGKMIDKKAGAKRKIVGNLSGGGAYSKGSSNVGIGQLVKSADGNHKDGRKTAPTRGEYFGKITEPSTELAKKYDGWGTALKPAQEPIVLARKPLSEKTVAANVIKHTTGAINIDGCRVGNETIRTQYVETSKDMHFRYDGKGQKQTGEYKDNVGRFPANIIHDGSAEVLHLFPDSNGSGGTVPNVKITGYGDGIGTGKAEYFGGERTKVNSGNGSAARFFYCAKANKQDRNDGCEEITAESITNSKGNGLGRVCNICSASILKPCDCENNSWILPVTNKNNHPTVKPTALMMYLIKLITPVGGTVLDPFNGSGSTGKAAMLCKDYNYIGIDLSADYIKISKARIIDALLQNKEADIDTHNIDDDFYTESLEDNNFFIE